MEKSISYGELAELEDAFDAYVKQQKACLSEIQRSESLADFVNTYVNADEFQTVNEYKEAVLNGGVWSFACDISEPSGNPYEKAEEMEKNGSGAVQENGYKFKTTFWSDFSIADRFGVRAVQDTFNRAFSEWKSNVIYLTELVLVLNWKIYQFDGLSKSETKQANEAAEIGKRAQIFATSSKTEDEAKKHADAIIFAENEKRRHEQRAKVAEELAVLYDKLWKQADEYACSNLKGIERRYFYDVTD